MMELTKDMLTSKQLLYILEKNITKINYYDRENKDIRYILGNRCNKKYD